MSERITINFMGREVGVLYHPETSEAAFRDEMIARSLQRKRSNNDDHF